MNHIGLTRLCESAFGTTGAPVQCTEVPADLAAEFVGDYSNKFEIGYGGYNFFSPVTTFSPPDGFMAAGENMPLGAIVGRLRSSTTLGLTNNPCDPGLSDTYTLQVDFTFQNSTTDTKLAIKTLDNAQVGAEGANEPLRDDINGNGLPDIVDFYPDFLNQLFDPDRNGDINGDGDESDTVAEASSQSYSPVVTLTAGIDNAVTSFTYTSTGDPIVAGHVIQIDAELMLVNTVTPTTNTLDVTRGHLSSPAAAHLATTEIKKYIGGGEGTLGIDTNGDGDKTDSVDLNGDTVIAGTVAENGPLPPLKPLARYAGTTMVNTTAIALQMLVFEPGQLSVLADPNPFSDYDESLGYPTLTILNDPNQALSPSAITDYCTPLNSSTVYTGYTRDNPCTAGGTGTAVQCLNNPTVCATGTCGNGAAINTPTVCTNTVDDDGDTVINDGCVNVGIGESGANCNDGLDNDGDLLIDDGCPRRGPDSGQDLAEVLDTDNDSGQNLAAALNDTQTNVPVTSDAPFSNGQYIRIDNENMKVVLKAANVLTVERHALGSVAAAHAIATDVFIVETDVDVTSGAPFSVGKFIRIDNENMEITAVAVNTLTVKRGQDGTAAVAHANGTSVFHAVGEMNDPDVAEGHHKTGGEAGAIRAKNPKAGTGIQGTGTHIYTSMTQSYRDFDNDGYENYLDSCPYDTVATDSGQNLAEDLDASETNVDVTNGSPFAKGSPQNGWQYILVDSEIMEIRDKAANTLTTVVRGAKGTTAATHTNGTDVFFVPDDPRVNNPDGDAINSICDPTSVNTGQANHDQDGSGVPWGGWSNGLDFCPLNFNPTQRETDLHLPRTLTTPNGGNQKGDNIGDACEGAEHAAQCANAIDDDGDTKINDGCPMIGTLAETGTQCDNDTDQDSANDTAEPGGPGARVNDGCPTVDKDGLNLTSSGHFHASIDFTAKCIGALDSDGDGYCDTLEDALGSDKGLGGNDTESYQHEQPAIAEDKGAGGAETVDGGQCGADTNDDDGDTIINDGCPVVDGAAEIAEDCAPNEALPLDDDGDGAINDGCFAVGRGNCSDGVDNDGDTQTDGADAGCKTPEYYSLEFPLPLTNRGAGPDANNDSIPDNDGAGPANDDPIDEVTGAGQAEEPHQVCSDDLNQDGDADIDAAAFDNQGVADGTTSDSGCTTIPVDDPDKDGILTASDNCPNDYNPDQKNTDTLADGGDACDTDDDQDGQTDINEWKCGYRSLDASSNGTSSCNYDPAVWKVIDHTRGPNNTTTDKWDRDGDGWTLAQEILIGTEPPGSTIDDDPCGNNGWPGDLLANNILNIGDFNSFTAPARLDGSFNMYDHPVPDPGFNTERWNLDQQGGGISIINIGDVNTINPGVDALTSRPPMFRGDPAFFTNGGLCPFAP